MTVEKHYAVVEVENVEDAQVTLKGEEEWITELFEAKDIRTLLQRELGEKGRVGNHKVEVIPRRGFQALEGEEEG